MATEAEPEPAEAEQPSQPASSSTGPSHAQRPSFKDRMALGAYIADPGAYPGAVIFHDADFVAVRDLFPKATVHALLLPRWPLDALLQRPLDVLANDGELLARLRVAAERLRGLVAAQLAREVGRWSEADSRRQAVLDGRESEAGEAEGEGQGEREKEGPGDVPRLPRGRDWAAEVRCGLHLVPSMRHLHVHVISRDMHSASLRHRKHYNSFTTPFFVALHQLPLPPADPRRSAHHLARDLVCWRCGRNFGNRFRRLKEHLDAEFDEWKRE
ncbi:hypothetical protein CDD82_825 [Ophiocordyceps australis]|uniref:Uncharacterized protein n=1 Tax=Ophiocordyceps australis TaxID=1399860 RepID=A0A2C5YMG1_9HYPO|nr:hypothetical protein CDD82_825 [Ophiocordyceps australis]